MFKDNPIIVDSNSRRNKKQKIFCVLCYPKIQLDCISELVEEENKGGQQLRYKCPRCKNTYQLGYEIIEHEDILESSHEDDDNIELSGLESIGSSGLLIKDNELEFPSLDEEHEEESRKNKIPIPKYFKGSETTKIIKYNEIIEEE
jgi:phage FluMu protein Com